jgi:lipopolysaccharide export system permease protein
MNIGKLKFLAKFHLVLSVMDLYIAKELFLPFLFGMGMFTSLALSIGTLFDLVRKVTESGLLLSIAIQVLLLKLPEFVVLAFPMSMLLAALMAYSRLSSDSELIALRSIGVNIYRLLVPVVIFSLFVVLITFVVHNFVSPAANYQAELTLEKALDKIEPSFKERNIIYPEYDKVELADGNKETILTRLFYAEEFDGQQMKGLTILDRSQVGVNQVVTAESATWNISENTWDFFNGTIYLIANDGSYRNIVRFQHQQLALPRTPLDITKEGRDYGQMNILQAQEYLKIVKLRGDDKKVRKLEVRIQEKIAFPFVCLVFALIGAAIGTRPQNNSKATSFGICVGLIFAYYLLSFIISSMGVWGVLSPFLAAWLPNILGFTAAGLLITGSSR